MRCSCIAAAIALVLAAQPSRAASVRVNFAGHVSGFQATSDVLDPAAAIGGSIQVGTPFSGYLTFDDAAPPISWSAEDANFPGYPAETDYRFRATDWAFHTEVGAYTTDASADIPFLPGLGGPLLPGGYDIGFNDWEIDPFRPDEAHVHAQVGLLPAPAGSTLDLVYVQLVLTGGTVAEPLHATPVPLSAVPWSLVAFSDPNPQLRWKFLDGAGRIVDVLGTLGSLAVPEPRLGALVAFAAAAIAARGYRRARS